MWMMGDGVTGADSIQEAIELQCQLQDLFSKGGFHLRKWNSSEPQAIQHLPAGLKDTKPTQELPTSGEYTKTLGIQWIASNYLHPLLYHWKLWQNVALSQTWQRPLIPLGWFSPLPSKPRFSCSSCAQTLPPIIPIDQFSSFIMLKRITVWTIRFVQDCLHKSPTERNKAHLTTSELQATENYWTKVIQTANFESDLTSLQRKNLSLDPVHYCLCNHSSMIQVSCM